MKNLKSESKTLGILGGMGPRASAHVMNRVYELSSYSREQESPPLITFSLPNVPDRSEAHLADSLKEKFIDQLILQLQRLASLDVSETLIACYTAYSFWDRIPKNLRASIVNLPRLATDLALFEKGPVLILGTSGFKASRTLEKQASWSAISDRTLYPSEDEQKKLHEAIYQIKINGAQTESIDTITEIIEKHSATCILACSELSLIRRDLEKKCKNKIIDPIEVYLESRLETRSPSKNKVFPVMTENELQEVFLLRRDAYVGAGKLSYCKDKIDYAKDKNESSSSILVAKRKGQILGSIRIGFPKGKRESYILDSSGTSSLPVRFNEVSEISRLCTAPEEQGKRVAIDLIAASLRLASNCGREKVLLTAAGNLISKYKSYGATPTGIQFKHPIYNNIPHEILIGDIRRMTAKGRATFSKQPSLYVLSKSAQYSRMAFKV